MAKFPTSKNQITWTEPENIARLVHKSQERLLNIFQSISSRERRQDQSIWWVKEWKG